MINLDNVKSIGRYKILRKLGHGSLGYVYLGRDPYIERKVAVKVYRPPQVNSPDEFERYRKRFFMEAQSAGGLFHNNIVTVYDADIHHDLCYIAMEYIDGPMLKKFCSPDNLLPLERVLKVIFRVCKGLEYAHDNGVIHRDIKPSNILLNSSGHVKITDFSIAYIKKGESTLLKGLFGSPSYMSPEQVKEDIITEKSDLFSLGVVFYELLSGKKPFEGENEYSIMYKIVNEKHPGIHDLRPELPKSLDRILDKALAKDLSERYQNSMEFAYDIRLLMQEIETGQRKTRNNELLPYVEGVSFFQDFTDKQLNEMLSVCNLVKVEKDQVVIEQGGIEDSFYVLISGQVAVISGDTTVAVIEKGECFGEMAYLTGNARSATIISQNECILLKFSSTLLEKLSESIQLIFHRNFTKTIISRLSKNN
jgi:eukaryotic-like serine/threonine-protein kinase